MCSISWFFCKGTRSTRIVISCLTIPKLYIVPFSIFHLKISPTLSHSILIASHCYNQFTYGRKTINASFEEFKGKACPFFLSEWFRQKGLGKLCKKFESLLINFVFCVINVIIKTLMEQFHWRDNKMLSSCIGCLLIIYYFKYLGKYGVVIMAGN